MGTESESISEVESPGNMRPRTSSEWSEEREVGTQEEQDWIDIWGRGIGWSKLGLP